MILAATTLESIATLIAALGSLAATLAAVLAGRRGRQVQTQVSDVQQTIQNGANSEDLANVKEQMAEVKGIVSGKAAANATPGT